MRTGFACFLVLGLLSAMCACKKPPQQSEDPLNRVVRTPTPAANNFLHQTFKVGSYERFEFEVPPRQINPKLHGSFSATMAGNTSAGASVDLLVMTPEEFEDFVQGKGKGGTASYSVQGTQGQTVDYALPPTLDEAQKYYLVFRNSARGTAKSVQADFTLAFE
jgi:hypothetical protein